MRHRDLLTLYKEYVDPNHVCEWIREEQLVTSGLAVKARSNCILQSPRLSELGIYMRPIGVALLDTMIKYAATRRVTPEAKPLPARNTPAPFHFLKQHPREMKGIILAGGTGSRLAPLTHITNKHLLPIYNRPMILYPLQTLLDAGIRDILLVTGPDHAHQFMKLLGSGSNYQCRLSYRIQDQAGGIAQALGMAEDFVGADNCTVILGDNIFEDNVLPHVSAFQNGAMTFYKAVPDPERFGVVEMDASGNVRSIEEKPKQPKSNLAQVGLYAYEPSVFEIINTLKPSGRGELEITDVNNQFLAQGKLSAKPIKGFWSDAGTFASLKRCNDFFANREGV
jgi:glucose-1-phosphate thymidylyltransferase